MGCLFFYFLFLALMNNKLQNICSGMLCHVRVFVSVHAASCYAPITIAAQSHPGWTDYPICVDRIDLQDIFIHLTIYSVKACLVLECLHEISQLVFPLPLLPILLCHYCYALLCLLILLSVVATQPRYHLHSQQQPRNVTNVTFYAKYDLNVGT